MIANIPIHLSWLVQQFYPFRASWKSERLNQLLWQHLLGPGQYHSPFAMSTTSLPHSKAKTLFALSHLSCSSLGLVFAITSLNLSNTSQEAQWYSSPLEAEALVAQGNSYWDLACYCKPSQFLSEPDGVTASHVCFPHLLPLNHSQYLQMSRFFVQMKINFKVGFEPKCAISTVAVSLCSLWFASWSCWQHRQWLQVGCLPSHLLVSENRWPGWRSFLPLDFLGYFNLTSSVEPTVLSKVIVEEASWIS